MPLLRMDFLKPASLVVASHFRAPRKVLVARIAEFGVSFPWLFDSILHTTFPHDFVAVLIGVGVFPVTRW
jgi:hypothetical protein